MSEQNTVGETKAKVSRRDYGVSCLEFSELWNSSATTQEVVDKLTALSVSRGKLKVGEAIKKNIVAARAAVYRAKKINLKKMNRKAMRIDVAAVNAKLATNDAAAPNA